MNSKNSGIEYFEILFFMDFLWFENTRARYFVVKTSVLKRASERELFICFRFVGALLL